MTDGTLLVASYNQEATLIAVSNPPPSFTPLPATTTRSNNSANYVIIALLALIAGGGLVALIMFSRSSGNQSPAQLPANSPLPATNTQNQPTARQSQEDTQRPGLPPTARQITTQRLAPLTANDVKNLLANWESAQDRQSFPAYQSCYDNPFEGIKRTTKGSSQVYNYGQWMNDRHKMFANAAGLNVDLTDVSIQVNGETATVEFEQFYYSKRYSDRGPKVIRIKQTVNGPKIFYEELKYSTPLVE